MSISKQLVNLMGGDINVSSKYGVGSIFSFVIDVQTSDDLSHSLLTKETLDTKKQFKLDLHGKNILIVEDNELNQVVVSGILKRYGSDIICANNGKEALELIKKNNYDMIFMDLHMPVMDGLETTKYIRNLEFPKSKVHIIAMSAAVSKEDQQLCLENEMDDFISKPIEKQVLVSKVQNFFASKKTNYIDYIISKYDVDEIQAKRYIQIFLNSSDKFEEEIKNTIDSNDSKGAKMVVHKMKSSMGSITNGYVFEFIKKVDNDLKNSILNGKDILKLIELINILKTELIKEIK